MVEIISCIKCGNCCKSLLKEKRGVSQTLFLFKDEATKLVKIAKQKGIKIKIQPKNGGSTVGGKKPEIIFSYQFENNTCPFFNEKTALCSIYEDRPTVCRSYPIEDLSPFILDRDCSWVKKKTNNLSFLAAVLPDDMRIEVETILNWISLYQNTLNGMLFWNFDLKTKKWVLDKKD